MFNAISNVPIFRRLFIVFAFATVVPIIVIIVLGNFYLQTLQTRSQAVKASVQSQDQSTELLSDLQHMHDFLHTRFTQAYSNGNANPNADASLIIPGNMTGSDISETEAEFEQDLDNYHRQYEIATSDNMGSVLAILQGDAPNSTVVQDQKTAFESVAVLPSLQQCLWGTYKQQQDRVLTDLDPVQHVTYQATMADLAKADQTFITLKATWQKVVNAATTANGIVTSVGSSATTPLIIATIVAILFTLLVIIVAGYLISTTITTPLSRLVELTRRISDGETTARAPVQGRDEISQVASAMNGMLDRIVRLIQESQERHMVLQAQLEKLVNEVSGLGDGDLRVQAEVTTDELGVLADSFNFVAEELGTLVINVKTLAREVQSATAQSFTHMTQLTRDADHQIKQISQAAVEVSNVSTSSRQVADSANELYEVAQGTQQTAQNGRRAVRQTVESIERVNENVRSTSEKVQSLGDRSREISNIVNVISSIAHQTNRLALDAAIQAAMAGENGKGFSAVASDIRRQAERAKEQATIITQIVRDVLEDINLAAYSMRDTEHATSSGTHLAQEAGRALESIFSVIEHQGDEISQIKQVAVQQVQSSATAVQIMQGVSDATLQSSATTHKATQQMERLARLAAQLQSSVEVFKLRENRAQSQMLVSEVNQYSEQRQLSHSQPLPALAAPASASNSGAGFPPPNNGRSTHSSPDQGAFPVPAYPVSAGQPTTPAPEPREAPAYANGRNQWSFPQQTPVQQEPFPQNGDRRSRP